MPFIVHFHELYNFNYFHEIRMYGQKTDGQTCQIEKKLVILFVFDIVMTARSGQGHYFF